MDLSETMERQRAARLRLHSQRRRVGHLRNRVVAISLIVFVVIWGVVFAQMATGNDPVLGNSSSAVTNTTAASVARKAIETSAPEELESELVEPQPVAEEPAEEELIEVEPEPEPAPVTTSQS
jgi:hypothetical protein